MFWPTRLTYSTTTGSVMRWADFSISMEYCLPVDISQLVEYQLVTPRPPMLRVPMASTSSSLPFLMCGSRSSPGEGSESDLAAPAVLAAGGLDAVSDAVSGLLSVFALVSLGTPKAGRSELLADDWVGCAAGWVDAGCVAAAGCVVAGAVAAGAVAVESAGVVADGVVEEGAGCCALALAAEVSRAAASRVARAKWLPGRIRFLRRGAAARAGRGTAPY